MQTAEYYGRILNAQEDLADPAPGYHGEPPNQERIPAAAAAMTEA